jgi:hypothetical protein
LWRHGFQDRRLSRDGQRGRIFEAGDSRFNVVVNPNPDIANA